MSSSSIIQIAANRKKPYDYLIDDNQISFFKQVIKRSTNFIIEPKEQIFGNKPNFGQKVSCTISKNGNAISQIYVIIEIPDIPTYNNSELMKIAWIKNIGYGIIKNVEIEIGGIVYDRHNYDTLYILSQLSTPKSLKESHNKMIGNLDILYELSSNKESYKLYIPLQFWFCKNYNLCLPLIALEYMDVKINIEFNTIDNILIIGPTHYIDIEEYIIPFDENDYIYQILPDGKIIYGIYINYKDNKLYYIKQHNNLSFTLPQNEIEENIKKYRIYNLKGYYITPLNNTIENNYNNTNLININNISINYASLLINYLYFDIEERNFFINNKLTYIIDYIQYDNEKRIISAFDKININYNNLCKEIIFVSQLDQIINGYFKDKFNYTSNVIDGKNLIKKASLLLDGTERISNREIEYFNNIQLYQNHLSSYNNNTLINCYSFCLYPENITPSGTINFSKFQNIQLILEMNKYVSYTNPVIIKIYAISYNIIEIDKGMSKLLY